jgi:hypothetical protein
MTDHTSDMRTLFTLSSNASGRIVAVAFRLPPGARRRVVVYRITRMQYDAFALAGWGTSGTTADAVPWLPEEAQKATV